jgi:hypothetical protein
MWCGVSAINQKESDMNATAALPIGGVDLAKSVFQLAVADGCWRVVALHRLTRTQFERWFVNRVVGLVVMEACGSAHHWAHWLNGLGSEAYLNALKRRGSPQLASMMETAKNI